MKMKSALSIAASLVCLLGGMVPAYPQTWTLAGAPTNLWWNSIAASADGSKLVAAARYVYTTPPTPGAICVSTNRGETWLCTLESSNLNCQAAAMSADGSRVIVTTRGVGGTNWVPVYLSTDSGLTWTQTVAPCRYSQAVASSADGNRLAVAGYYPFGAQICLSTNAGATWVTSSAPVMNWSAIASSADGSRLVATVQDGQIIVDNQPTNWTGLIYLSTNSGATWTPASAPRTNWFAIASSADGTRLAAAGYSFLYTSTNALSRSIPQPVLDIRPSPGGIAVSWTVPSMDFVLQCSPACSAGWTDLPTPQLNLTNLKYEIVVSPTESKGFYRLEKR